MHNISSPASVSPASASDAQEKLGGLTKREREVLLKLADGLADEDLARELGIAERTVRAHMARITQKLHVQSRLQAALMADRHREALLR
ncbi:helix-turn-helix domain-containing protein [Streptomyces tailanensis]|uniref:helix-turn-helix domain-containing protein n=1 Tax=Streptomyces tailanensis TaxID=2569858 RepID=UPI00122DF06F|nr:helix-turn-helix transcriptional regulator [Streptomyces tailanensis]